MVAEKDSCSSWVFLGCAVVAHCVVYGVCVTGGLLNAYLLDTFDESRSFTSLPATLATSSLVAGGVLVTPLINRYGCHIALLLGAFLSTLGMILSAFATGISYLIVCYGLITGIGMAASYLAINVAVSQQFDKYRTIALGIMTCGSAAGCIVFPPLVHFLTGLYSWRGSCLVLSGLSFNLVILVMLLWNNETQNGQRKSFKMCERVPNGSPITKSRPTVPLELTGSVEFLSSLSLDRMFSGSRGFKKSNMTSSVMSLPQLENKKAEISHSPLFATKMHQEEEPRTNSNFFHWNIFKNKVYLCLSAAAFSRGWGKSSWIIHITAIGLHRVLPYHEAPNILLVMGSVNLFFRPVASLVASCFSSRKIFIWSLSGTLSAIWLSLGLILTHSRAAFYVYIGIFGAIDGVGDTLWASVFLDAVGEESLGSALGATGLIYGIGQCFAAPLAGFLYDRYGTYDGTFYLGGSTYLLFGLLSFIGAILRMMEGRKRKIILDSDI